MKTKLYTYEDIAVIIGKIGNNEELTDLERLQLKAAVNDSLTTNHSGKMGGMWSISTSVLLNENCKKNAQNKALICSHCYAMTLLKMRHSLEDKLALNTLLYTKAVLPLWALPQLNCLYFRFEAFGDLNNSVQVENYFNMAKNNSAVKCALWTKNPQFIKEAIENGNSKPNNLNIVYSSPILNKKSENIREAFPFIDIVFTVYDKETIEKENIVINCGALSCIGCLKCYNGTAEEINEKLK